MLKSLFSGAAMVLALGALTACDVAYPVTVIGQDGMTFRGSATNTFLHGGSFHATNGNTVCTGQYSKHVDITRVSFPVVCNNGMRGLGRAEFESETRGSGDVIMQDGSRWVFIFGKHAALL